MTKPISHDHAHHTRKLGHLSDQLRQLLQMEASAVADGAVTREGARRQHPSGQVLMQLALDPVRTKGPGGVGKHLDRQRQLTRLTERALAPHSACRARPVPRIRLCR